MGVVLYAGSGYLPNKVFSGLSPTTTSFYRRVPVPWASPGCLFLAGRGWFAVGRVPILAGKRCMRTWPHRSPWNLAGGVRDMSVSCQRRSTQTFRTHKTRNVHHPLTIPQQRAYVQTTWSSDHAVFQFRQQGFFMLLGKVFRSLKSGGSLRSGTWNLGPCFSLVAPVATYD